nr:MAG TPA: hypothetical protein [Caudoviricetes sp.]
MVPVSVLLRYFPHSYHSEELVPLLGWPTSLFILLRIWDNSHQV